MMRIFMLLALAGLWVAGCSQWFPDPYPDLMETERRLIAACEQVGMIAETADADNVFAFDAKDNMILRVRERAVALGATHIVWLHRTATSAAAEAYRCPLRQ
jgi:hypothetical protein